MGTLLMADSPAARPILSAAWFRAEERATATAVITCTPYVGVSLGFVVGPLLMAPGLFPAGPARPHRTALAFFRGETRSRREVGACL